MEKEATLVSSPFIALGFFVCSCHIFKIRISLLTSGDSWYLPKGAEKNLTGSSAVRGGGLSTMGLTTGWSGTPHVIIFYLFTLAGQSHQRRILQSSLWRIFVRLPACRGRELGQYLNFHWIFLFLIHLTSPENKPSVFCWVGKSPRCNDLERTSNCFFNTRPAKTVFCCFPVLQCKWGFFSVFTINSLRVFLRSSVSYC